MCANHVCHTSALIRQFSNNWFATVLARDPRSSASSVTPNNPSRVRDAIKTLPARPPSIGIRPNILPRVHSRYLRRIGIGAPATCGDN